MKKTNTLKYEVLSPNLQISFYYRLQELGELYLHSALRKTIKKLDLGIVNGQLEQFVSKDHLKKVASFGMRGEIFFPVPILLESNPFLLAYYRLLFGLSQKSFYNKGPFGKFKKLEESGQITSQARNDLAELCESLIKTAEALVDGIDRISLSVVHDLQLLTIGPQLRGSENTRIGQGATVEVFELIKDFVGSYVKETTDRTIRIVNESGRTVMIEFFSDPDVRITEKLSSGVRPLVSMEIKGGTDASNIHNRIGEAEKSHQKAKNQGFFEFWTIIRANVDLENAKRESPTTSYFFHLDSILHGISDENRKFKELLSSIIGIK